MSYTDQDVFDRMQDLANVIKQAKPEDRSSKDRAYAVTRTEFEKVISFFYTFIIEQKRFA